MNMNEQTNQVNQVLGRKLDNIEELMLSGTLLDSQLKVIEHFINYLEFEKSTDDE